MRIDKETLNKIAHLSRLEIAEKDVEKMMQDMTNMVTFVEKLNEVNTEGVEPLTTMTHEINRLREDEPKQDQSQEQVMHNAPKKDTDYFRVPKVLE
jgi:aspartyl-tRNA(Asn)/glutamyl-tRNA(Gln) amidotransferase subunit C